MAYVEVKCVRCGSKEVIKYGKRPNGHQRYRCKTCFKTFQLDYKCKACDAEVRTQIVNMAMNGCGTRDTARTLGISKDTVTATLRKIKTPVKPVNEVYLEKKFLKVNPLI